MDSIDLDSVVCMRIGIYNPRRTAPSLGDCRYCTGIDPKKRINCSGYSPAVPLRLPNGEVIALPVKVTEVRRAVQEDSLVA